MSSVSFSVDWEGGQASEEAEMVEPRRAVSEGQGKGASWEISFNNSPVKPRKFSPKIFKESKSSPGQSKASPSNVSRSTTSPGQNKASPSIPSRSKTNPSPFSSKSNTSSPRLSLNSKPTNSMRSVSTPLKASGAQSYIKPVAAFSKPRTIPVPTRSFSERNIGTPPKKQLPTIRKPLLPVTSPTKKPSQIPELRSHSDSTLSFRAPNKTVTNGVTQSSKKLRPQSASSVLSGRKPLQKVQSLQQLRTSQEQRHLGGFGMEKKKGENDTKTVDKDVS